MPDFGPDDGVLRTWFRYDSALCLHRADIEALRANDVPRALVLELLRGPPASDLFGACARLGQLLGVAGASPTLVVGTLDGAARALADAGFACSSSVLSQARASMAEAYVAALREAERAASVRAWDYPNCAIALTRHSVGIVASPPVEDAEAQTAWVGQTAHGVSRDGFKHARLTGSPAVVAELTAALDLLGVEVTCRTNATRRSLSQVVRSLLRRTLSARS